MGFQTLKPKKIELVPVVEFGPELFKQGSREFVPIDSANYKTLSEKFWFDMLSDWGIVGIQPYDRGSWFVRLSDVGDHALDVLVRQHLSSEYFLNQDIDEVMPFDGGLVFDTDLGRVFPQCCGDMSDIENWRDMLAQDCLDNEPLWIGHPWLSVTKFGSKNIKIAETTEYPIDHDLRIFEISPQDLKGTFDVALKDTISFQKRVERACKNLGLERVSALSKILCGFQDVDEL